MQRDPRINPRPLKDGAYLLAVLERDDDDKVLCQAPGCHRPIFAAVHVVAQPDGRVRVLGPRCVELLHSGQAALQGSDKPAVPPHPGEAAVSLDPETRDGFATETEALARRYQAAYAEYRRLEAERARELARVRRERAVQASRRERYLEVLRSLYGAQADEELAGPRRDEILERTIQHLDQQPEVIHWRRPENAQRLEAEARNLLVEWLAQDADEEHEHAPAAY